MKYLLLIILLSTQVKADVIFKNDFEFKCSSNMYPAGYRVAVMTYKSVNDGLPFFESTNTSFLLNMDKSILYSLSGFSLPQAEARRRIVFENAPSNVNLMDQGTMSISTCPGDFSESATCLFTVNNSKTLLFSTKQADSPANFCKLDPNKVYYANYVLSTEPGTKPPSCANESHNKCAMFYTEAGL